LISQRRRFVAPAAIQIFAVDVTSAQLVWRALPAGAAHVDVEPVVGRKPARRFEVAFPASPGGLELTGLLPDTEYRATVVTEDDQRHVAFRTQPASNGPVLTRIATVNDVHIGSYQFGVAGAIKERPVPEVWSGERCARAAFSEIAEWNPDHLVIKGDFVHRMQDWEWEVGGELISDLGVPWDFALGNHETRENDLPVDDFANWNYDISEPVRTRDLPGVRLVVADTAVAFSDYGELGHIHEPIVQAASESKLPVIVFLHHNLQQRVRAWMAPAGISSTTAAPLLDDLHDVRPGALVVSGHTHRHRRRQHKSITVVEVGSTKDYPGTWTAYEVSDNAVRQVVRRVLRPDAMTWTERTRKGALSAWGRWSPGSLEDRCFLHHW